MKPPKKIKVKEVKLGRHGWADADVTFTDKRATIRIDPRLNALSKLDCLIHELIHVWTDNKMSETKVRKMATYLAKGVWKNGYRKKSDG